MSKFRQISECGKRYKINQYGCVLGKNEHVMKQYHGRNGKYVMLDGAYGKEKWYIKQLLDMYWFDCDGEVKPE